MTFPLDGGCQCGGVRYRITQAPIVVYACHCTICQRQSGSAFGLSARFAATAIALTEGQPATFTRPGSEGHVLTNSFCADCGVRLFTTTTRRPEQINLKPGTLDDTSWLRPAFHIFTRSAQPWVTLGDLPAYETMPPDAGVFRGGAARG